ncbi:MAG TPA: transporter substrate-binding domain-containing protein, partial [Acidimicrobiales bacterium]|nr:transporter substrate-binding domain-containing protein [Acidimicrobiales bacterium]
MRGRPAAVLTAAVVTAAVVLAGCGATDNGGAVGGANGGKSATTLPAGTLRADLPAAVASAGALRVGIESGSAPLSSTGSGGTPTGLDVELLQAAARLLGTSITFVGESQAAIGAGLRSGKLDLGVGALADSASSRAGGLHFMDYLRGQLA